MKEDLSLIDRIYECALLPELWPSVLDSLADVAGAPGGYVFAANPKLLNWTSSEFLREGFAGAVQSGAFMQSERIPQLIRLNHAGFVRNTDFLTDDQMGRDRIYPDHLWPLGLGPCAATLARLPTGDMLVVAVEGRRASGPIPSSAVALLDEMRPHIVRSAFLSARLQLERARVASETLAMLGLPAIVFDNGGRVVLANTPAEGLDKQIRWRAKDMISLVDADADLLLQQALASLHIDTCVRSFAIRRTDEVSGMIVHVVPIRGVARDVFSRCAAIMVLTPLTTPEAPSIDLIQSLFDLTPAEARVASGLVAGKTPDEIASRGKVSLNTVRTQVRGVLEKTGCRRQTDFVALVSGSSMMRPKAL